MPNIPDQEIIDKFKSAHSANEAFSLLVNKYKEKLYWHIRRMLVVHEDTNDVLQNTFVKIWKGMAKYRGDSKLYTWLYRIATNESLTFLEKKKKRYASNIQDVEHELANSLRTDNLFDGDQIMKLLQEAILTLPEKQRLVFNMRYFEEMKYNDMSEILGTSVGALKASYFHAAKKIEEFIKSN